MVDTHCHLADPRFREDLGLVLKRAQLAGIERIINVGYDTETSHQVVQMAQEYNWLLPAVGIHPNEASTQTIKEMDEIRALIEKYPIRAVGETGLDFYRDYASAQDQEKLFYLHIKLAREFHLPLIIHTRDALNEAINILKNTESVSGIFHCYSGDYTGACHILDMGFFISFAGNLTYNKNIQEVLRKIGTHQLLLETDAPYLAPAGYRGKRNEPTFIFETLKKAAEILHIPAQKLERIIEENVSRLFSS